MFCLIEIPEKYQCPSKIVCGYLTYLLSHGFSPKHKDVIYTPNKSQQMSHFAKSIKELKSKNDSKINAEIGSIDHFYKYICNGPTQTMSILLNDDTHAFTQGVFTIEEIFFFVCRYFCLRLYLCLCVLCVKIVTDTAQKTLECTPSDAEEIAWRVHMWGQTCMACSDDEELTKLIKKVLKKFKLFNVFFCFCFFCFLFFFFEYFVCQNMKTHTH